MKKLEVNYHLNLDKVKKTHLKTISKLVDLSEATRSKTKRFFSYIRDVVINKLNCENRFISRAYEEIMSSFSLFCETVENEVNKNREWKDTIITLQSLYSLYIRNYVRQLRSLSYYKACVFLNSDRYHHLQVIYVSARMMIYILRLITWDKAILEPIISRGMIGHSNYLNFFANPLGWIDIFDFVNSFRYMGSGVCEKVLHQRNCGWVLESICNALIRSTITYPWFKMKNAFSAAFSDHDIEYIPSNVSKRDIAGVARFISTFNEKRGVDMLINVKAFIQRSVDLYSDFENDTTCYGSVKEQAVQDRHSAAWGILDTMHLARICMALDERYSEVEALRKLCKRLETTLGHITRLEKLILI